MISSLNRRIVVGSSRADAELSTSTTTSPSMIHAVATSGRSVYRTLGKGKLKDKTDREFYRRNRDAIDIKRRYSETEEEIIKGWT